MVNSQDTRLLEYERRYEQENLCAYCNEQATHRVGTSTSTRREDNSTFGLTYGTCSGHAGRSGLPAYLTPDL